MILIIIGATIFGSMVGYAFRKKTYALKKRYLMDELNTQILTKQRHEKTIATLKYVAKERAKEETK
tara:strand:+ start:425 stop:622 length:198 start_codon:yes stop_codon:yes gene_type:complete